MAKKSASGRPDVVRSRTRSCADNTQRSVWASGERWPASDEDATLQLQQAGVEAENMRNKEYARRHSSAMRKTSREGIGWNEFLFPPYPARTSGSDAAAFAYVCRVGVGGPGDPLLHIRRQPGAGHSLDCVSVTSNDSSFLINHAMNLVSSRAADRDRAGLEHSEPSIIVTNDTDAEMSFSGHNSRLRKPSEAMTNSDMTFKQQFLSMFQPATDNKLALKLFGSVTAVTKERERIASSKHWIIHPASNFRFYFDLFMLIVLLANLMILPVSISFFNDDFSIPWIVFNCFSDTIFIIDLVCNFRTGLINPENAAVVVLDPKEIARRYVRSWFFVDLISSIPFDYVVLVISIWDDDFAKSQIVHAGRALRILRMAKLLSLIKLLRLSRLVRYVSQFEEIYFLNIAGVFMRIFNFMCLMMLMAHWSGCIQFLVPMLQGFPRDSWVVINELEHAPWFEQYTWSFFKAISHQLSIGYGRYPPQSVSDAWLTVLSMLTGAFTYALFIGHASNLIHSLDASRRQYREKWKQVEEYMAYRKLPRQLRSKISDFYEHRFQGKIFNEEAILEELNDPIRELIINYNCRDLVSSVPFFSHADPNFVTAVITRLKYEFFLPGDIIVREGTLGDKMYFIQEGLVEIYMDATDENAEPTIITCLSDGSYFGEISLLTIAKRVASVRAQSCCSLFSLQSDQFNCVLNEYPLMRHALESVAAERLNKIGKDPTIVTQRSFNRLNELDRDADHGIVINSIPIIPIATIAPLSAEEPDVLPSVSHNHFPPYLPPLATRRPSQQLKYNHQPYNSRSGTLHPLYETEHASQQAHATPQLRPNDRLEPIDLQCDRDAQQVLLPKDHQRLNTTV